MDNPEVFKKRYEREKRARKEAEKLLEEKSFQLYQTNQELSKLNESLENKVKNRTQQLEKMNADLEKFTYISSHDLKTPLRSIYHIAQWIEEDYKSGDQEEILSNIKLLKSRVQRLENLINGILEYTTVGKEKSLPAMVDVAQLVNEICMYESTNKDFQYDIELGLPIIFTNKLQLFRIFSNLITNAIKHNDKEVKILKIGSKKISDETHQFFVEDNGIGISELFHQKIFDMFQTLDRNYASETTGVGLSIVKKLIEDNGGQINIESEEGEGSKFIFTWNETENDK